MKKFINLTLLISTLLLPLQAFSAQEYLVGKVKNIEIDYRGWYSFELNPSTNLQGCAQGNKYILNSAEMTENVKKAMLAIIMAAEVTGASVQINVVGCDPVTTRVLVWQVKKLTV